MARRTNRSSRAAGRREVVLLSRAALLVMSGASERELEVWEREELIAPVEQAPLDSGGEPLYDRETLRRIRVIRTLADELEVNLPGIGVILNLLDQFGG
jgi:DNA-binding transcriptional MerR regulator